MWDHTAREGQARRLKTATKQFCRLILAALIACVPELPSLPERDEDSPQEVVILDLQPAGGGTVQSADALVAGRVYQLRARVSGASGQPLPGEPLTVSVQTESFDELVRFPRGNGCVTPHSPASPEEAGSCSVIFRLVGPIAPLGLLVRAQRALEVSALLQIAPRPAQEELILAVQVPKVGTARWSPDEIDPLLGLDPLPLAMDDEQAAPLTLTLTDVFGNPLSGVRILLSDPPEEEPEPGPDAGPASPDATAPDSALNSPDSNAGDGATGDGSLGDQGPEAEAGGDGPADSGPADIRLVGDVLSDVAATEAGVPDGSGSGGDGGSSSDSGSHDSDGGSSDGGAEAEIPQPRVLLANWDPRTGCGASGQEALEVEGQTDAEGKLVFCLLAGPEAGAWKKLIRIPELLSPIAILDDDDGAFTLSGATRSGAPAQLQLANALEGGLPLVRCDPNGFSPPILFRVLSRNDAPVAGASVSIEPRGEIELLTPLLALSDDEGLARVLLRCPAALPAGAEVVASLVGTDEQITVQIRLDVSRIDQIRIRPAEGVAPEDLGYAAVGEPMRFIAFAVDADGNPAADSRLEMTVLPFVPGSILRYGSPASCLQDLVGGGLPRGTDMHQTSCRTDINGQIPFDIYAEGPSTLLYPTLLTVRAAGQNTRATLPIYVLPGAPARVVLIPGGQIQAALGGAGGPVTARVLDAGGNGVPGIGIQFNPSTCGSNRSRLCSNNFGCPIVGNCQGSEERCIRDREGCICEGGIEEGRCDRPTVGYSLSHDSGVTDPSGEVTVWVLAVNEEGAHPLKAHAFSDALQFSAVADMEIIAGAGVPQHIALYQRGRRLFDIDGAAQIDMPVGGGLSPPLTLRVENDVGGGIAGQGVVIDLAEGNPAHCGRVGVDGLISDEAGELEMGGEAGVEFVAGIHLGNCVWSLQVGLQARRLLRVVQGPGAPFGGGPVTGEGIELVSLQRPPSEWREPPPVATVVTLQARDRYDNPSAGLRVWLDGENCWIQNRIQTLDEAGQAQWYVAGGPDHNSDCVLHPRHEWGDWEEAEGLTIPLTGVVSPIIDGLDQRIGDCARFGSCAWPAHAPHGCAGPCYIRGPHLQLRGNEERELIIRIPATRIIRPAEMVAQASGVCIGEGLDPYQHCSKIQFGDAEQLGDGSWRYEAERDLTIRWRTVANVHEFFINLQPSWFKDARVKALRIVQPDGHTVGPWEQIYMGTPLKWSTVSSQILPLSEEGGSPEIKGGFRRHLDDDGVQEIVLCGLDSLGGWHGVIDPDAVGQLPETSEVSRTWLSEGPNPRFPAASRSGTACALGDFNEDGIDDLVVPMETSDDHRLPRLRLHPGQAAAPFFGEGVTLILSQAVANQPVDNLRIQSSPNRLRLCFGSLGGNDDCNGNGHSTLEAQGNPFVGDPNAAFGVMTNQGLWGHKPIFAQAARVYFEGIGELGPSGDLVPVQPWPRVNLVHQAGGHSTFTSADGQELFTFNADIVRVFDTASGQVIRSFAAPQGALLSTISPDGRLGSSQSGGSGTIVWRTSDGEVLYAVDGVAGRFSPDGSIFVTRPASGTNFRIYGAGTGELINTFDHETTIPSFDLGGQGQRIVTVNHSSEEVVIYDLEGTVLRRWGIDPYNGYGNLYHAKINPITDDLLLARECGRFGASCSEMIPADAEVYRWRVGEGSAWFSRDGRYVIHSGVIRDAATGTHLLNHSATGKSAWHDPTLLTWPVGTRFRGDNGWDLNARRMDDVVPFALMPPSYANRPGLLLEQSEDDGWAPFIRSDRFELEQASTWRADCGDFVVQPDERYDFGPPLMGPTDCGADGKEHCGDGDVDPGEECDPGADQNHPSCGQDCLSKAGSERAGALNSCADLGPDALVPRPRWINPNSEDPDQAFLAYCLPYGDGLPWTLALKNNGRSEILNFDGELWTNEEALNPEAPSLSGSEDYKYPSWSRLEVTELLVAMDSPSDSLRVLRAPIGPPPEPGEGEEAISAGPLSLHALFNGPPRALETTQQDWLDLSESGAGPRASCQYMGINQRTNAGAGDDEQRFRLGAFSSNWHWRGYCEGFHWTALGKSPGHPAGHHGAPRVGYLFVR